MNSVGIVSSAAPVGAYGLTLTGLDPGQSAELLQPAPIDAPAWAIVHRPGPANQRITDEILDGDHAELLLTSGGWIVADRAEQRIVVHLPEQHISTGSLVHPFMAKGCMAAAHWRGALALHAGAFVIDGRAWGVIGPKGAGKSTTMAMLDRAGIPVLTDDLLIIDEGQVPAGPRLIDLRPSAAEQFPAAVNVGRMGLRVRWRLPLSPAPWSAPLGGFLVLGWADDLSVTPIPVQQRLEVISSALNVYLPPADPRVFLDLAALPMHAVARPRQFGTEPALVALISEVSAQASPA